MDTLELIAQKLDRVEDRLGSIDRILERNTCSLEEHMRRTSMLEQEIRPIKTHVQMMNAGAKVFTGISAIVGFLKVTGLLDAALYSIKQ